MPDATPTIQDAAARGAQIEADLLALDTAELEIDSDSSQSDDSASQRSAETEAGAQGWVPKDQFKGPAAKWIDAETFLERGKGFHKKLTDEVASLKAKVQRTDALGKQFQKFHEEAMAAKQVELDTAIKQLKKDHREAIRDGDDDAADALEGRIDVLNREKATAKVVPEAPAEPQMSPIVEAWIADGNQWFQNDSKLQRYAVDLGAELKAKGETAEGREFLDKITAIMREDFPTKFGNQLRNRPGTVDSGSSRAATSAAGPTERDLPPEDRRLMREFIEAGWTTRDKFLSEYRWDKK